MRILHVGNFSWFSSSHKRVDNVARHYAPDRKITNGLIRNGHSVWDLSYRDTARALSPLNMGKKRGAAKMQQHLMNIAKQFLPDIILLGHCELIQPQTLMHLRDALPHCKIAQWWVDPLYIDAPLPALCEKQPYLDAFFATTAPSYYASRIGNSNSNSTMHYLPNIIDKSVEVGQSFAAAQHDYDVVFAGADIPMRKEVLAAVAQIANVRCGFFGIGDEKMRGGMHLMNAIAAAKMGLNLSQAEDVPLYSSDRIAQIIGNGALAIVPRVPELSNLFNEDEVAYCESLSTVPQVVERYLQDDASCRRIARAGWQRGHQSYNEQRVTKFMIEATMGESFSEEYEWLYASIQK